MDSKERPLAVAISALIKDGKILLIKRARGDYVGLFGLPGGKVEMDEHLSEAAVREILEESGIKSKFKSHLGLVSEHLIEGGKLSKHFLLHVCGLESETTEIIKGSEGDLEWFGLSDLSAVKDRIIPSDFLIIEKIIKNREGWYYDCVLEKIEDRYVLRKFE